LVVVVVGGLEQLSGHQDLVDLVGHKRVLIYECAYYTDGVNLRLQAHVFAVILDGEIVLVGSLGGESVHYAVAGLQHLQGLVNGDAVV